MDVQRPCFVDEVTVPIRLYSTVTLASHNSPGLQVHNVSTLEALKSFSSRTMIRGSDCFLYAPCGLTFSPWLMKWNQINISATLLGSIANY